MVNLFKIMIGHQIIKNHVKTSIIGHWRIGRSCDRRMVTDSRIKRRINDPSMKRGISLIHQIINYTFYTKTNHNGVHDTAVWDYWTIVGNSKLFSYLPFIWTILYLLYIWSNMLYVHITNINIKATNCSKLGWLK